MVEMDDELLNTYLAEAKEHLAGIEEDMLAIEEAGANIDEKRVNKVFRAAHSVKGGAGFFGLNKIQELAHKTENVLSLVRSREIVPNSENVNMLLRAFDRLREMINEPQASESCDNAAIIDGLVGLAARNLPREKKDSVTKVVQMRVPGKEISIGVSAFDLEQAEKDGNAVYILQYDLIHDIQRLGRTPLDEMNALQGSGTLLECLLDIQAVGTLDDPPSSAIPFYVLHASRLDTAALCAQTGLKGEKVALVSKPVPLKGDRKQAAVAVQAAQASQGEGTLRVGVNLLEKLMNLAGELVLSRNQLVDAISRKDMQSLNSCGQRVSSVTSELQEAIMLTRMQPLGTIFGKFPRIVRDMAKDLGKEIQLEIVGKDVATDKTIIEGLSDPLTHMVRNSVDHGIETITAREKAGKGRAGKVELKAYYEAGQVIIEIKDDGKGIDCEKVAAAAISKGLLTPEQVNLLSEKEKTSLIFLPGLSTAEKVTDVSGRGVGMDVVKTNLDKLGGKIEIETKVGRGTVFRIKLPLTLAIIPSLVVSVGEERFAIPQVNVGELISIKPEQIKERIEVIGDKEVLLLRGSLIPLVHLADVLGAKRTFADPTDGTRKADRRCQAADRRSPRHELFEDEKPGKTDVAVEERLWEGRRSGGERRRNPGSDLHVVVVNAGVIQYGLIIEKLHDTVEIVVKPLGRRLKALKEYAGATIMGDGQVALILDVGGVANKAKLNSLAGSARAQELNTESQRAAHEEIQQLLIFRNAPDEQAAVPLSLVARVEQVSPRQVEMIGGKRTMQYRGASLPLMELKDIASVGCLTEKESWVVIVFEIGGREIGLLAAKPVDVVDVVLAIDHSTLKQKGVMGSAIVKERTTLLVDIFEMAESLCPAQRTRQERTCLGGAALPTIVLAEDSEFFRNQLMAFLSGAGYEVLSAADGQGAWEILVREAEKVRLLVTDIEMPEMSGLELTERIRSDAKLARLPVIAVTSLASEDDEARGRAAGVTEYQIKLDKEKLLASVQRCLNGLS